MNKYLHASFLLLLSSSLMFGQTPATSASQGGSGFEGTIVISPTHPGPIRKGAEPSIKPLPGVTFEVMKEGESVPIASFTTDDAGKFRVSVPPGRYIITKEGGKRGIGHFGPFPVEVSAGKMTATGELRCDSGMR